MLLDENSCPSTCTDLFNVTAKWYVSKFPQNVYCNNYWLRTLGSLINIETFGFSSSCVGKWTCSYNPGLHIAKISGDPGRCIPALGENPGQFLLSDFFNVIPVSFGGCCIFPSKLIYIYFKIFDRKKNHFFFAKICGATFWRLPPDLGP